MSHVIECIDNVVTIGKAVNPTNIRNHAQHTLENKIKLLGAKRVVEIPDIQRMLFLIGCCRDEHWNILSFCHQLMPRQYDDIHTNYAYVLYGMCYTGNIVAFRDMINRYPNWKPNRAACVYYCGYTNQKEMFHAVMGPSTESCCIEAIKGAIKGECTKFLDYCINLYAMHDLGTALFAAAASTSTQSRMIEHLEKQFSADITNTMRKQARHIAAYYGNVAVVTYYFPISDDHALTALYAFMENQTNVCKLYTTSIMMPDMANVALLGAAITGNVELFQVCLREFGATNVNRCVIIAAANGHTNILKIVRPLVSTETLYKAMHKAAKYGYITMLTYGYNKYGLRDPTELLKWSLTAAKYNNVNIVKALYAKTKDRVDMIAERAAECNSLEVLKLCILEYKCTNIRDLFTIALNERFIKMARFIWTHQKRYQLGLEGTLERNTFHKHPVITIKEDVWLRTE